MGCRHSSCFHVVANDLEDYDTPPYERGECAQVMGDKEAAQEHTEEARTILCGAGGSIPEQGPLRARYSNLQAFLQQVC